MNQPYLVIDFETQDPYIGKQYGSGFVFRLNHDYDDFRLLGMGWSLYKAGNLSSQGYYTDTGEMCCLLQQFAGIPWIFFNAQYDLGCILVLLKIEFQEGWKDVWETHFRDTLMIDTQILCRAYRQDLMKYSLDYCTQHFNLEHKKLGHLLDDYVWESGMFQEYVQFTKGRKSHKRPANGTLHKFAITNLHRMPVDVVGQYCLADVEATANLYEHLKDKVEINIEMFSNLIKEVLAIRCRGMTIDLDRARKNSNKLLKIEEFIERALEQYSYYNWKSGNDLALLLDELGIPYPLTGKGKPSIKGDFLENSGNKVLKYIAAWRKYNKIRTCFIDKIIKYQGVFHDNKNNKRGKIYISLNILGASTTGRFTSGPYRQTETDKGFEVNIQQIPARDPVLGRMCRRLFIAQEGHKLICADFSNQEQRIQVDLGEKLGVTGASVVGDRWRADPHLSIHQLVADLTGLSKKDAKTINLAISYGAGAGKICNALGYETVSRTFTKRDGTKISYQAATGKGKEILDRYHKLMPYITELSKFVNKVFEEQGYVRTIDGRKLSVQWTKLPNGQWMNDVKNGFNKYTQGSAAGQVIKAMTDFRKYSNLPILCQVHDELVVEVPEDEVKAAALKVKEIMETAYTLTVPVIAEIGIGNNWAEAK